MVSASGYRSQSLSWLQVRAQVKAQCCPRLRLSRIHLLQLLLMDRWKGGGVKLIPHRGPSTVTSSGPTSQTPSFCHFKEV